MEYPIIVGLCLVCFLLGGWAGIDYKTSKSKNESKICAVKIHLPDGVQGLPEDERKHAETMEKFLKVQELVNSLDIPKFDSASLLKVIDFEIWYHEKKVIEYLGRESYNKFKNEATHANPL